MLGQREETLRTSPQRSSKSFSSRSSAWLAECVISFSKRINSWWSKMSRQRNRGSDCKTAYWGAIAHLADHRLCVNPVCRHLPGLRSGNFQVIAQNVVVPQLQVRDTCPCERHKKGCCLVKRGTYPFPCGTSLAATPLTACGCRAADAGCPTQQKTCCGSILCAKREHCWILPRSNEIALLSGEWRVIHDSAGKQLCEGPKIFKFFHHLFQRSRYCTTSTSRRRRTRMPCLPRLHCANSARILRISSRVVAGCLRERCYWRPIALRASHTHRNQIARAALGQTQPLQTTLNVQAGPHVISKLPPSHSSRPEGEGEVRRETFGMTSGCCAKNSTASKRLLMSSTETNGASARGKVRQVGGKLRAALRYAESKRAPEAVTV